MFIFKIYCSSESNRLGNKLFNPHKLEILLSGNFEKRGDFLIFFS